MRRLEERQQQQRGSLGSGALGSHELGPGKVEVAWLFMRTEAKAAGSAGRVKRAGLGTWELP